MGNAEGRDADRKEAQEPEKRPGRAANDPSDDCRLTREEASLAATQLDRGTREVLFDLLLGEFEVEPDPEIEAAWMEEVARRMRDFDEGRVQGIPGEEVMAKARAFLEEPRPEPPKVRVGSREVTAWQVIEACLELPPEDRVALAAQMLAALAESREAEIDSTWLRDSEGWLARARQALEASAADAEQSEARREDEEDLADVRAARCEIEEEGTIPWEEVKRELG